ncbi:hypothetical protein [Sinorhizobium terangae]|uniref:hypothetical protein n=1 Tax=Sinorhizobium terangae TaxID=110322 RepID=UPI0024B14BC0|nr:hypothetical protein [Sinorhizobium terangae]WFU51146.1 hypothetical protein QA637_21370 [Sinorhizobium terangae]
MPGVAFLVSRFPQHELLIHRLHARNADFMAICEDYSEALSALRRWEETPGGETKVAEYRSFLKELEAEVALFLDRQGHLPG